MSQLTVRQSLPPGLQRWLEHLRACEARGCSLKQYAREHGLSVQAAYVAKSELKRRGAWPCRAADIPLTLVPVSLPQPVREQRTVIRVALGSGTVIEVLEPASAEQVAAVVGAVR